MKRLFVSLLAVVAVLAVAPARAPAQDVAQDWSYAAAFNLKAKTWAHVITHPIGQLLAVAGNENLNLDIDGFAGYDVGTQDAIAGVSADVRFPLARNASALLGAGAFVSDGRPVSAALLIGLSVHF